MLIKRSRLMEGSIHQTSLWKRPIRWKPHLILPCREFKYNPIQKQTLGFVILLTKRLMIVKTVSNFVIFIKYTIDVWVTKRASVKNKVRYFWSLFYTPPPPTYSLHNFKSDLRFKAELKPFSFSWNLYNVRNNLRPSNFIK